MPEYRRKQLANLADKLFDPVLQDWQEGNISFFTSAAIAEGVKMTIKGRHSSHEVERATELAEKMVEDVQGQIENGEQ